MSNNDLERIINNLNSLGNNIFYNGIDENNIINFENNNNIKLPNQLKKFYLFADGCQFFLPSGLQLYGILHKPIIDLNDNSRPSKDYSVIGALSNGDTILCNNHSEKIYIYNHEAKIIESDEIYPDFMTFLNDLPSILGL